MSFKPGSHTACNDHGNNGFLVKTEQSISRITAQGWNHFVNVVGLEAAWKASLCPVSIGS